MQCTIFSEVPELLGRSLFLITIIPDGNFSVSCLSCYNLGCWHTLTAAFVPCFAFLARCRAWRESDAVIELLKGKGDRAGLSSHPCCLQDQESMDAGGMLQLPYRSHSSSLGVYFSVPEEPSTVQGNRE